jgi:perosamine synthetase
MTSMKQTIKSKMGDHRETSVAICAAFQPGWEMLQFAVAQSHTVCFVATSSRDDEYEERIAELCRLHNIPCLRRADVNSAEFRGELRQHEIELVFLAWWPTIVRQESIDLVEHGWVNQHPSLLPFNRGKHPYYWSIVEGTPFGATIHLIDEGVDTGPILFQREIPVGAAETGETLYQKGVQASIELFCETYEQIVTLDFTPVPQDEAGATFHHSRQLDPHSRIDLQREYRAGDLLNIIRGRTFFGGDSACFEQDGRTYRVRVVIDDVTETSADPASSKDDVDSSIDAISPIYMAGPWITEHEVQTVADAMRNGWYENPYWYCEELQREFASYHNRKHALMTPNCTSAIHLLLTAIGIEEGDEVIVPECTWIATAAPINQLRAVPVFCDIERDSWCLDPESVERSITAQTKAIIVVDLYGNMPRMAELQAIADKHGLFLIEDAAEAVGSTLQGTKAGQFGIGSVFSFHRTKTMTTGEGGMLLLDDDRLFERCTILRDHGRHPGSATYLNEEVAYKYMPFNVQAALGYAQFQRIGELVAKKRWILNSYKEKLADLPDVEFNIEPADVVNGAWITAMVPGASYGLDKHELMQRLAKVGVPSRPFFYPLSSLPAYPCAEEVYRARNPVAYDISSRGINLPGAMNLTEQQIDFVCDGIHRVLNLVRDAKPSEGAAA